MFNLYISSFQKKINIKYNILFIQLLYMLECPFYTVYIVLKQIIILYFIDSSGLYNKHCKLHLNELNIFLHITTYTKLSR